MKIDANLKANVKHERRADRVVGDAKYNRVQASRGLKSVWLLAILMPLLFAAGCASEGTQTKSTDDGALAAANQARAEAEQALKAAQEAQLAAKQASDKADLMYQRTLRK
jgi:hypothetical protein